MKDRSTHYKEAIIEAQTPSEEISFYGNNIFLKEEGFLMEQYHPRMTCAITKHIVQFNETTSLERSTKSDKNRYCRYSATSDTDIDGVDITYNESTEFIYPHHSKEGILISNIRFHENGKVKSAIWNFGKISDKRNFVIRSDSFHNKRFTKFISFDELGRIQEIKTPDHEREIIISLKLNGFRNSNFNATHFFADDYGYQSSNSRMSLEYKDKERSFKLNTNTSTAFFDYTDDHFLIREVHLATATIGQVNGRNVSISKVGLDPLDEFPIKWLEITEATRLYNEQGKKIKIKGSSKIFF